MMVRLCRLFVATVLGLAATTVSSGAVAEELSLGAPFSDGMVLQRGQPVPVWGWGEPGNLVEVRLSSEIATTRVNSDGLWRVELAPMEAATGLTLSVTSGDQKLQYAELAAGDVFLCSGQSNMVWKMSASALRPDDRQALIDKQIRLLTVPWVSAQTEQSRFGERTPWLSAADNWADFSAVCLFAGRQIANSEGIVVGLVNSSWGGTPIRAWLPYEGLSMAGGMEDRLAILDEYRRDPIAAEETYGAMLADLWEGRPSPKRTKKGKEGYANLFNGMIAPLGSMRVRGGIWYQGENNANNAEGTASYRKLLEALIGSWRGRLGSDTPFVIVQLAGYGKLSGEAGNDDWAAVREAQRLVARDDPSTELVVTIDVSERLDIHPPLKKPVGHRAAAAFLKLAYGKPDAYRPPEARSAYRVGDAVEIAISHEGGPLFAASWGSPGPFMLCEDAAGEVCEFAAGQFSEDGVTIAVPQGSNPVLVRYCWDAAPICNVFDQTEIPLGPFELVVE